MAEMGCTRKLYFIFASVALISLGGASLLLHRWKDSRARTEAILQATVEAERHLTQLHGKEVREVIKNFNSKWDTLETMRDPSIRSELAVTPFLNDYRRSTPTPASSAICDTRPCLIVTAVDVKGVRVLEYSADRFKAIACGAAYLEYVNAEGVTVSSVAPLDFQDIYVFVSEKSTWKVAGLFDISIPKDAYRDWDYAPAWLRQVIGDLPDDIQNCEPMR